MPTHTSNLTPDGWLRYIVPPEDSNHARWPIHPAWELIQHAYEEPSLPVSAYEQELADRKAMQKEADVFLELNPFKRSKYVIDAGVSSFEEELLLENGYNCERQE